MSIEFLPGRNQASAAGLMLLAAIWTGILYFLLKVDIPRILAFMWGAFNPILLAESSPACLTESRARRPGAT